MASNVSQRFYLICLTLWWSWRDLLYWIYSLPVFFCLGWEVMCQKISFMPLRMLILTQSLILNLYFADFEWLLYKVLQTSCALGVFTSAEFILIIRCTISTNVDPQNPLTQLSSLCNWWWEIVVQTSATLTVLSSYWNAWLLQLWSCCMWKKKNAFLSNFVISCF